MIIRDQFHVHKFNNFDETEQVLERYKLPNHTQKETGNPNGPIYILKKKDMY